MEGDQRSIPTHGQSVTEYCRISSLYRSGNIGLQNTWIMEAPETPTLSSYSTSAYSVVPLSFREVRFANAYLEHGNATKAVRDAGYTCASEQAFWQMGSMLLRKTQVVEYMREAMGEFLEAEKATTRKIAQRLANIAFGDRTGIFDDEGAVLNPKAWPPELRASILSLDVREVADRKTGLPVRTYRVKFANPTEALRVLATWKGMTAARAATGVSDSSGGGVTVILEKREGCRECRQGVARTADQ